MSGEQRKPIEDLAEKLMVSEERSAQLDIDRKRLSLDHSIVLHRDSASAADVLAMIEHLQKAGMPLTATLRMDGPDNHTRLWARWSEVPA